MRTIPITLAMLVLVLAGPARASTQVHLLDERLAPSVPAPNLLAGAGDGVSNTASMVTGVGLVVLGSGAVLVGGIGIALDLVSLGLPGSDSNSIEPLFIEIPLLVVGVVGICLGVRVLESTGSGARVADVVARPVEPSMEHRRTPSTTPLAWAGRF